LKVLHFYKTSLPDSHGGVEQFIHQLARGSAQRGVEVDVLSLSSAKPDGTSQFENYTIHRINRDFEIASTAFSFKAIAKFASLARLADVVHYHFPWPFADLVHFATSVSKPSLLTYHSDIVRQRKLLRLYRPLMNRFLGDVDRIVATSQNYLESSDVLARFREKTSVIPIGLDPSTYPTPNDTLTARWRERLGDRFFLFVGVLRYYKGLHLLIEANRDLDYPLVIVGAGPVEAELRQHAADAGLKRISFLGALPDVDKVALFNLCYAIVFPSHLRSEAFGISLLEGAMFGKPMISSEISTGTSFINSHQETGLVVAPGDPNALRDAMRYLHDNPTRANEMGRQAYHRYLQHFTSGQMVERYADVYRQITTRRSL
jgi:glycosyltransferase involved in cell wall biosynthesis